MPLDADAVHGAVVRALRESGRTTQDDEPLSERAIQGLAYHLSEWLSELEAFHAFASEPDATTGAEVLALLERLLDQVPTHLREAQRVWTS
jgi:hypothetical protein